MLGNLLCVGFVFVRHIGEYNFLDNIIPPNGGFHESGRRW